MNLLFDFRGRIDGPRFVRLSVCAYAALVIGIWALSPPPSEASEVGFLHAIGQIVDRPGSSLGRALEQGWPIAPGALALLMVCGWAYLALSAKRLRDAGQNTRLLWAALLVPPPAWILLLGLLRKLEDRTGRRGSEGVPAP